MPQLIKKNLPVLIFLILVYSWFLIFQVISRPSVLKVLGADRNVEVFVQPEAGRAPILEAIDSAQKEVLVEVYLLSDEEVINALDRADDRGVDVKVMLEENPFGGGGINNKTEAALRQRGVEVQWANPSYALTHQKTIVIDGIKVFILNQNLTKSAFDKNREFDVIDVNPSDVKEIRNIFIADWRRESFSPSKTHLILSPVNSRAALTTLLKSATSTIEIEMEVLVDNEIVNLLSELSKKVDIKIIIPSFSQISANKKAVEKLVASGAKIKTVSSPYIHSKMILADDVKAYVGSINFSNQSMDENREAGIMITQIDAVQTIDQTFEQDWASGTDISYGPEFLFLTIDKYLSAVL